MIIELELGDKRRIRDILGEKYTTITDIIMDDEVFSQLLSSNEVEPDLKGKLELIRGKMLGTVKQDVGTEIVEKYKEAVELNQIINEDLLSSIVNRVNGEYLVLGGNSLFVFDIDKEEYEELLSHPIIRVDELDRILRSNMSGINSRILYRDPLLKHVKIDRTKSVYFDYDSLTAIIEGKTYTFRGSISGLTSTGIKVVVNEATLKEDVPYTFHITSEFHLDFDRRRHTFYTPSVLKQYVSYTYYRKIISSYVQPLQFFDYNIDRIEIRDIKRFELEASKEIKWRNSTVESRFLIDNRSIYLEIIPRGIENLDLESILGFMRKKGNKYVINVIRKRFGRDILLLPELMANYVFYVKGFYKEKNIEELLDKARIYIIQKYLDPPKRNPNFLKEDPLISLHMMAVLDGTGELLESITRGVIPHMLPKEYISPDEIIYFPSTPDIFIDGKRLSKLIGEKQTARLIDKLVKSDVTRINTIGIFNEGVLMRRRWVRRLVLAKSRDIIVISKALEVATREEVIEFIKNRRDLLSKDHSFFTYSILSKIGKKCKSDSTMYCTVPLYYLLLLSDNKKEFYSLGVERGKYYISSKHRPNEKYYILGYNGTSVIVSTNEYGKNPFVVSLDRMWELGRKQKRIRRRASK